MDKCYCFLDYILTDMKNNSVAYSVVVSSQDFQNIYTVDVTLDQLRELLSEDYIFDFGISNGILMCSEVIRLVASLSSLENCGVKHYVDFNDGTLYALITEGVRNQYLLLDSDFEGMDSYVGAAVTPFNRIRASQSTMTVYADLLDIEQNKMHRKKLIAMYEYLTSNPFYFAVKHGQSLDERYGAEFQKSMLINNVEYDVYYLNRISIYSDNFVFSGSLTNKAVTMREKVLTAISFLKEAIRVIEHEINSNSELLPWIHSKSSSETPRGIFFTSSIIRYTQKSIRGFVERFYELVRNGMSPELACADILGDDKNFLLQIGLEPIKKAVENGNSTVEVLGYLLNFLDKYSELLTYLDMFLYRLRSTSLVRTTPLTARSDACLHGGNEDAFTLVNVV